MPSDETITKRQVRVRPFWVFFPVIILVCLGFALSGLSKRRAACETSAILTTLIASDPRFSNVVVATATAGVSIVEGSVASEADMAALHRLVEQANTPQRPQFAVHVLAPGSP